MKISPLTTLVVLLALMFTLATRLALTADNWSSRAKSGNVFGMMFGDGRKLFANHFFTMADVYFHSGYYPSVFDKHAEEQKEIISASHGKKETEEDEKNEDFMGRPKDWVEAFGRNFASRSIRTLSNIRSGKFSRGCASPPIWTRKKSRPSLSVRFFCVSIWGGLNRLRRFCAKVCATIPIAAKFSSSWAAFTTKAITKPTAPEMSGCWE